MNATTIAALAAATLSAAAMQANAGDVQSQTINYSWDANGDWVIGSLNAFDDQGGNLELTGVNIIAQGSVEWDITVLNYTDQAFEPGEWFAEGFSNVNVFLGEFGSGLEYIAGGVGFNGLTGSLSAGTGGPFGEPGEVTVTGSYLGSLSLDVDVDQSDLAFFTDGSFNARLLGFSDITFDGPNGAPGIMSVQSDRFASEGFLTVNYSYRAVPAPGAAALLGLAGALTARRRR